MFLQLGDHLTLTVSCPRLVARTLRSLGHAGSRPVGPTRSARGPGAIIQWEEDPGPHSMTQETEKPIERLAELSEGQYLIAS